MKKITIITVCYNSSKTIERCIKSVINQIDESIEYLIIDGKSSDDTMKIINKYKDSYNIKVLSEKDNGIYDAMNKGVNNATGEWLFFLNSDDCLKDRVIEKMKRNVDKYNYFDCIYGDIEEVRIYKRNEYFKVFKGGEDLKKLSKGMIFSHQSFLCRRKDVIEVGGFNTEFKIAGDWDLICKLYKKGLKFKHIDLVIAQFYYGGASSKPNTIERHRVRKENKLYSLVDIYFFVDIFKGAKTILSEKILKEKKQKFIVKSYNLRKYKGEETI